MAIIPPIFETFKRVFESQLLYTYLIFYVAIGMGAMYEFLFIVSFVLLLVTGLLTYAYVKKNDKLIIVGKIANVAVTFVCFINIFACDLYYNDFALTI